MSAEAARERVGAWVDSYERAWRTGGTESLRDLFVEDATYRMSPYEDPASGLEEIAALWEREREGPDESRVQSRYSASNMGSAKT